MVDKFAIKNDYLIHNAALTKMFNFTGLNRIITVLKSRLKPQYKPFKIEISMFLIEFVKG